MPASSPHEGEERSCGLVVPVHRELLALVSGVVMDSFAVGGPSGGLRVGLFPSDAVRIDQFLASFELLEPDGLCPVGSPLPHGRGRR
jgi:hypothetical protein